MKKKSLPSPLLLPGPRPQQCETRNGNFEVQCQGVPVVNVIMLSVLPEPFIRFTGQTQHEY